MQISSETFINLKKNAIRYIRFNEERCRLYYSNNLEFHTLLEIARHGATINVVSDFVSNNCPEPFRASHDSLQHTFLSHAFKFWQKSKSALLATSIAII